MNPLEYELRPLLDEFPLVQEIQVAVSKVYNDSDGYDYYMLIQVDGLATKEPGCYPWWTHEEFDLLQHFWDVPYEEIPPSDPKFSSVFTPRIYKAIHEGVESAFSPKHLNQIRDCQKKIQDMQTDLWRHHEYEALVSQPVLAVHKKIEDLMSRYPLLEEFDYLGYYMEEDYFRVFHVDGVSKKSEALPLDAALFSDDSKDPELFVSLDFWQEEATNKVWLVDADENNCPDVPQKIRQAYNQGIVAVFGEAHLQQIRMFLKEVEAMVPEIQKAYPPRYEHSFNIWQVS